MAKQEEGIEQIGILWSIDVQKKGKDESEKAAKNMISLIADLAIIGKVAADSLGKLWSNMQKTLELSLDKFDDINIGLTYSVDPEDVNALKYAVGQIGGDDKVAMSMLGEMDKLMRSVLAPETGEKEMVKLMETLGRAGVSDAATKDILNAIDENELVDALKLFGETRNELGDKFPKMMSDLGLTGLRNLKLDYQYEDWIEAWGRAADIVNEVDLEGLNDLENGMAKINTAFNELLLFFGALSGSGIDELGESILALTSVFMEWVNAFKLTPEAKALAGSVKDFASIKDTAFDTDSEMTPMQMRMNKMKQLLDIVKNVGNVRDMNNLSTEGLSTSEWALQSGMGNTGYNDSKGTTVTIDTINVPASDNPLDTAANIAEAIRSSMGTE